MFKKKNRFRLVLLPVLVFVLKQISHFDDSICREKNLYYENNQALHVEPLTNIFEFALLLPDFQPLIAGVYVLEIRSHCS